MNLTTVPIFSLTVMSPDETLYKGEVQSITATNGEGPFDILAYHINFVSIIHGKVKIKEVDGKEKELEIGDAILKAYENMVYIFVGIGKEQVTSL